MEKLSERDAEERYDEFLDNVFGEVNIGGYFYNTSYALKEIDPTAYREDFNNWLDSEDIELED